MDAPDWYISDTHFGHENIIEFCQRPFASTAEMDAALIRRFRECVKATDVVLWCGDVFFCPSERATYIMSQLPGRHLLVLGNHDRPAAAMTRLGFLMAVPEMTIRIADAIVRVSHHPKPVNSGEFCMHGHTHSKVRRGDNRLHVGVDAWDFAPVSRLELVALIELTA